MADAAGFSVWPVRRSRRLDLEFFVFWPADFLFAALPHHGTNAVVRVLVGKKGASFICTKNEPGRHEGGVRPRLKERSFSAACRLLNLQSASRQMRVVSFSYTGGVSGGRQA